MGFFDALMGQISGRRSNKHGEKAAGRDRSDIESQVYHSLKTLVGNRYEHLKTHKTARQIAHTVAQNLSGGDRDGWKYSNKENPENIKRDLVSTLEHGYHFPEKQALELANRIIPVIWK